MVDTAIWNEDQVKAKSKAGTGHLHQASQGIERRTKRDQWEPTRSREDELRVQKTKLEYAPHKQSTRCQYSNI